MSDTVVLVFVCVRSGTTWSNFVATWEIHRKV